MAQRRVERLELRHRAGSAWLRSAQLYVDVVPVLAGLLQNSREVVELRVLRSRRLWVARHAQVVAGGPHGAGDLVRQLHPDLRLGGTLQSDDDGPEILVQFAVICRWLSTLLPLGSRFILG